MPVFALAFIEKDTGKSLASDLHNFPLMPLLQELVRMLCG